MVTTALTLLPPVAQRRGASAADQSCRDDYGVASESSGVGTLLELARWRQLSTAFVRIGGAVDRPGAAPGGMSSTGTRPLASRNTLKTLLAITVSLWTMFPQLPKFAHGGSVRSLGQALDVGRTRKIERETGLEAPSRARGGAS